MAIPTVLSPFRDSPRLSFMKDAGFRKTEKQSFTWLGVSVRKGD